VRITGPFEHQTRSLRFGHLPRVEISDDDGNVWIGFDDKGTPIPITLKTPGPTLQAETAAAIAELEAKQQDQADQAARVAHLLTKAEAGTLTPAEIQEAIAHKVSRTAKGTVYQGEDD
jgi:hypothetical protein